MNVLVDFDAINDLFNNAYNEGRGFLYEYEVYKLLSVSGAESAPKTVFIGKEDEPPDELLSQIPGEKVVGKIVSPTILHKTEVGGVKVAPNKPSELRSAWRSMISRIPEAYTDYLNNNPSMAPKNYKGLEGEALKEAVTEDLHGMILCQFLPPDSSTFGNELIVGIRRSREFGMVINAGLGGTDTELYASHFKKGEAVVAASTELTDGETFFNLFKQTVAYKKVAGLSRGQKRIVQDEQLLECFTSFIMMANYYSPTNPEAPFVIEELEINPFTFTKGRVVPLDGLCKFTKPDEKPIERPLSKIDSLLHPESIGVIGVSSKGMNVGRIILRNILTGGFDPKKVCVIRPGLDELDGVACVPGIDALKEKLSLLVLAVDASQVPDMVEQIIDQDAADSVLLIPGGLGETSGSKERSKVIKKKISQSHTTAGGGPVFLGGNSLGLLSWPGNYDTLFIPEIKLPKHRGDHKRNSALISQSGAFMITRMSKLANLDPAYALSIGNQTDLTAGDLFRFIKDLPDIEVIAVYMEGFNNLDGLALSRAVREAVLLGKDVIFYKAGRTPEGKTATSGHTASLAGNYVVCESCLEQAGAMVADNFTEFEDLFRLAIDLREKKINGVNVAAMSNAGFESVGMADNLSGDGFKLKMSAFGEKTVKKLQKILDDARLDKLVDVKNPMDINPMANDGVNEDVIRAMIEDENVHAVVAGFVPLSPVMNTLPPGLADHDSIESEKSLVKRMPELYTQYEKPIVAVVDSGPLYDAFASSLEKGGLPVFRSSDRAMQILGKYMANRLKTEALRKQEE